MTIKEKAKAYNEAFERGKQILSTPYTAHWDTMKEVVEHLIPELKESEDERVRKALIEEISEWSEDTGFGSDVIPKDEILAWLEKQGEQKPTDNVEPKFKVGDWIYYTGDCYLITDIKDYYECETIHGERNTFTILSVNTHGHLWTIQDAKDGDVLINGSNIFIFKYLRKTVEGVTPATKEQRDLLFSKMKEAGYEWDANKKELKKIEQKFAEWSEEDELIKNAIIQLMSDCNYNNGWNCTYIENGNREVLFKDIESWLKSIKGRVGCEVNCTTSQKPSEEQMKALQTVIDFHTGAANVCMRNQLLTLRDYLKNIITYK